MSLSRGLAKIVAVATATSSLALAPFYLIKKQGISIGSPIC